MRSPPLDTYTIVYHCVTAGTQQSPTATGGVTVRLVRVPFIVVLLRHFGVLCLIDLSDGLGSLG